MTSFGRVWSKITEKNISKTTSLTSLLEQIGNSYSSSNINDTRQNYTESNGHLKKVPDISMDENERTKLNFKIPNHHNRTFYNYNSSKNQSSHIEVISANNKYNLSSNKSTRRDIEVLTNDNESVLKVNKNTVKKKENKNIMKKGPNNSVSKNSNFTSPNINVIVLSVYNLKLFYMFMFYLTYPSYISNYVSVLFDVSFYANQFML